MGLTPRRSIPGKKPSGIRKLRSITDMVTPTHMRTNYDAAVNRFRNEFLKRLSHFKEVISKLNRLRPAMRRMKRRLGFIDLRIRTMWETLRISRYLINNFPAVAADFRIIDNLAGERAMKHPAFFRKFHMDRMKHWRERIEALDWVQSYRRFEQQNELIKAMIQTKEQELLRRRCQLKFLELVKANEDVLRTLSVNDAKLAIKRLLNPYASEDENDSSLITNGPGSDGAANRTLDDASESEDSFQDLWR